MLYKMFPLNIYYKFVTKKSTFVYFKNFSYYIKKTKPRYTLFYKFKQP